MMIWHTNKGGLEHPGFNWIVTVEGFHFELSRLAVFALERSRVIVGQRTFNRDVFLPEHDCMVAQHIQDFHFQNKRDAILFALNSDREPLPD